MGIAEIYYAGDRAEDAPWSRHLCVKMGVFLSVRDGGNQPRIIEWYHPIHSWLRVCVEGTVGYLICVPTTRGLPWVAKSVEGPIDLPNDLRHGFRGVLVSHVVCMGW